MAKLTKEQKIFLDRVGVPLSRVFDASGMRTAEYKQAMRDLGLWVAYGVAPCDAERHTLRTRSGHCVQCRPANITYLRRHDEEAEVYVAWSQRGKLVKVGLAQKTEERLPHLNSYQYGGQSDWVTVYSLRCDRAGKVESIAHTTLARFAVSATYVNNGVDVECRELFKCTQSVALKAVQDAAKSQTNFGAKTVLDIESTQEHKHMANEKKIRSSKAKGESVSSEKYLRPRNKASDESKLVAHRTKVSPAPDPRKRYRFITVEILADVQKALLLATQDNDQNLSDAAESILSLLSTVLRYERTYLCLDTQRMYFNTICPALGIDWQERCA